MKHIALLLGLFIPFLQLHGAELTDLVLPGEAFGKGWELTQRNMIGSAVAPNYVNRTRTDQPVVMVNVIAFPSVQEAKNSLERKVNDPGVKQFVKKLGDLPVTYEQIIGVHRKRHILIQNYWLTVEQIGRQDDRNIFIQKYAELLKKQMESGPLKKELQGVMLFEFGMCDDAGKITTTTNIPWRVGNRYGWGATIFSQTPAVTLKEVLVLPAPATWIEKDIKRRPSQIIEQQENVADGRVLSREVKLDVTKPLRYGRNYKIIESDPEGDYILRLYINQELAREVRFKVEKPRNSTR